MDSLLSLGIGAFILLVVALPLVRASATHPAHTLIQDRRDTLTFADANAELFGVDTGLG